MNFANFIIWLFAITLIYYALMFLYDAYFKKGGEQKDDGEQVINIPGFEEEAPKEVEEIFESSFVAPEKKKILNDASIVSNDIINIEVESQGIPLELLMQEGRQMFAGVNF